MIMTCHTLHVHALPAAVSKTLNTTVSSAYPNLLKESAFEFSGSPSKKAIRDFLTSFDEGRAYPTGKGTCGSTIELGRVPVMIE